MQSRSAKLIKTLNLTRDRWNGLFRKDKLEDEMDEEMQFHIRMRIQENIKSGMTPTEAKRAAVRGFGHMGRIKEACRDVKGGGLMETFLQDVRYGARVLVKNPGFSAVAILILALGIGANTAIFSVVNAVIFRPLPYFQPDRIVHADWQWGTGDDTPNVTAQQFAFWKQSSKSLQDASAYSMTGSGYNLSGGSEPIRVRGFKADEAFLRVLGVNPILGRGFTPEEDRANGPCATIISEGLWQRYFGADRSVMGKQVDLNGRGCTVVGVLPRDFQFEEPVDMLMPLRLQVDPEDNGHNTQMVARLKPGLSLQQAQAEMDQLLPEFRRDYPSQTRPSDKGIHLVLIGQSVVRDVRETLFMLFGAVGFVLLIACANVASLLLARAAKRNGELAVRIALGAGRWRLVRQLMTENLMLALAGGALGLLLAYWAIPALLALQPGQMPRVDGIGLDRQAVAFALLAAVVTSLAFGIVPALQSTRVDVSKSLKGSSGRSGASSPVARLRSVLMVGEVALSVILLIGAALLIQSFVKMNSLSLGFDPHNLTTMQVSLNSVKYRTAAQTWALERQVLERIKNTPGVIDAATVPSLPMERGLNEYAIPKGGQIEDGVQVEGRQISPGYFATMGIGLQQGRFFTDSDMQTPNGIVIINERLARRLWPNRSALGELVTVENRPLQVIGIVSDIREMGLDQPVASTAYVPITKAGDGLVSALNQWFLTSWIIRTRGQVDLNGALREALKSADPQLPVAKIRPMTEVVSGSVLSQRFIMLMMAIFGGLALILTAVGMYGVLSYQVSQRTQEIGIRMAMGAQARDIVKLVVGQGMLVTLIGVVIGLGAAYGLTRLMASLLFGVGAKDPVTFVAISLLLLLVALTACLVPARRAIQVDPLVALRYE